MSHLSSSPPPEPKPVDGGSGTAGVALPVAAQRVSGASFSGSCATGKKKGGGRKGLPQTYRSVQLLLFSPAAHIRGGVAGPRSGPFNRFKSAWDRWPC